MSAEENKSLSRRFWEEVADKRNLELANELLVSGYIHHDPGLPPHMQQSRDAYIQHLPTFYAAFPDFHITVENMIAEGDRVATRWSFSGAHQGDLMGIPRTGKKVGASGTTIQRISNGKIVEGWTIFDVLGILQQLGVAPPPEQAGA